MIWDRLPPLKEESQCCRDGRSESYLTGWGYLFIGIACMIVLAGVWVWGRW